MSNWRFSRPPRWVLKQSAEWCMDIPPTEQRRSKRSMTTSSTKNIKAKNFSALRAENYGIWWCHFKGGSTPQRSNKEFWRGGGLPPPAAAATLLLAVCCLFPVNWSNLPNHPQVMIFQAPHLWCSHLPKCMMHWCSKHLKFRIVQKSPEGPLK